MMIEIGNIVKNLIPSEAVEITKLKKLGSKFSVEYMGINSGKHSSRILTAEQIDALEILTNEGEFNFKGNPEKFVLFAEAERIKSA